MFEDLKLNLSKEKGIIADMRSVVVAMGEGSGNRDFYLGTLRTLANQLDVLNNAVPELLNEWSLTGQPDVSRSSIKSPKIIAPKKEVSRVSYILPSSKGKEMVVLKAKDRKRFLENLKMSEDALRGIKGSEEKRNAAAVKRPSKFAGFSSRIFGRMTDSLASSFDSLGKDLKQANIRFLLSVYLSMALMSALIAGGVGFLIGIILLVLTFNFIFLLIPFGLVGLVFAAFYFYPASEASSVKKQISYELPFATIHMVAVAGSDIEPVKIFKIISRSDDYKAIGAEIRKVIMQVEVYGYDLVSALKSVGGVVSNKRLSELFSGLATNIASGGALKNYLEKKSENFLVDYRLERQRYTALAGTFMDVYISILIAAPLILMMLFIVMNVSGLGMTGISIELLLFFAVVVIIIVNIIFLFVINSKQPRV
jgi:flagellar protein FlaJ